ncbi:MAG: glycosyltransferase [Labilithrix sp.]|nr:glycosyltransferase [Labilithrix sp.]MCW5818140.1 glycosyltransferase [Labilithrix sp.]
MKVLDICDFFSERGGGVRSYLGELASEGAKRGHEITVVAPGPRDADDALPGGGRLVRLAGPPMPYDPSYHLLWRIDRIVSLVREVRPDVLQASSPYLPALLATRLEAPLRVFVYHSDQIATYVEPILQKVGSERLRRSVLHAVNAWPRALARRFDLTVAPSETIAKILVEAGCERVRLVKFGSRADIFQPRPPSAERRRQMMGDLAAKPNAALALVACRLAVEKRVNQIIDAVALVNEERPLALVVLGDGPERARLEKQARKLPQVVFPGFLPRSEFAELVASADVFVHAGAAETFGFVLGEALLAGTRIVVPDAGAAYDFVGPGLGEAYPAYGGPRAIADALLRSLDRPAGAAPDVAGRLRTSTEHFDELFALYEEELRRRSRAVTQ